VITAGGALVGAGLMAGVVLVSSLHGSPEQPLPGPAKALPAASSDAYLCSSTCPGYVPPDDSYHPAPMWLYAKHPTK
jgi:hypothetical protein